jgi:hypothetical protein
MELDCRKLFDKQAALESVGERGNLNLTFVSMFDMDTLKPITHIVCWYYPV